MQVQVWQEQIQTDSCHTFSVPGEAGEGTTVKEGVRILFDEMISDCIECFGAVSVLFIISLFFAFTDGIASTDSNVYKIIWEFLTTLVG